MRVTMLALLALPYAAVGCATPPRAADQPVERFQLDSALGSIAWRGWSKRSEFLWSQVGSQSVAHVPRTEASEVTDDPLFALTPFLPRNQFARRL